MKKIVLVLLFNINLITFSADIYKPFEIFKKIDGQEVTILKINDETAETAFLVFDKIRNYKKIDPLFIPLIYLKIAIHSKNNKFQQLVDQFIKKFNNAEFNIENEFKYPLKSNLIIDQNGKILDELKTLFLDNNYDKITSIEELSEMLHVLLLPYSDYVIGQDRYMFFLKDFFSFVVTDHSEASILAFKEYLKKLNDDNYQISNESKHLLLVMELINNSSEIPFKDFILDNKPKSRCRKAFNSCVIL